MAIGDRTVLNGPGTLRVGCALWGHRPWVGRFLPATTTAQQMLAEYSRILPAVEGNTTFYAVPAEQTVARWAAESSPGFRFVLKFPRRITHELRLRHCADELREFLERIEPLGERLGPTFAQLPPSFRPADLPALRSFLRLLPAGFVSGVEVRHRDFFAGGANERELDEMLREHSVDRVIMDARCVHAGPSETPAEIDEIRSKPNLPVRPVATSSQPVVRFIGQVDPAANPAFWEPWIDVCVRWVREGLDPYVFIHTPDNVESPRLAQQFADSVAARAASGAPG